MDIINQELYRKTLMGALPFVPQEPSSFLITGATGLIGSCLTDLLLLANEHGHRHSLYLLGRNGEKIRNRFNAAKHSELHIIEADVTNCNAQIEIYHFDYIIHGASYADPVSYSTHPTETLLTNILGTKSMLDYCQEYPTARMVLLSTFEVYGNKGIDVYQEKDYGIIDIDLIRSCYPESKRCAELLLHSYVEKYHVQAATARLCSIYGPTMKDDDSKAHAQFIKNGIKKEDIILKSKGLQKRTYCYVIDAVTAILTILTQGMAGEAYNVANENSISTIAELAATVAHITGTEIKYSAPSDLESKGFSKPQNCILDNTKLKALGWEGRYSVYDGLSETIALLTHQQQS